MLAWQANTDISMHMPVPSYILKADIHWSPAKYVAPEAKTDKLKQVASRSECTRGNV